MTRQMVLRSTVAASLLALGLAGCANMRPSQKVDTYQATLSGSQEVPANPSPGQGMAEVQVNPSTNTVNWKVTYSGLSGPVTGARGYPFAGLKRKSHGLSNIFAKTGHTIITPTRLPASMRLRVRVRKLVSG